MAPEPLLGASQDLSGPLKDEIDQVSREQLAGTSLSDAMRKLAGSSQAAPELRLFAHALVLTSQHQGDLTRVFPRLEKTLTSQIEAVDEAEAETAQVRLRAAIMGGIVPVAAGLLVLVSPTYLQEMSNDPLGKLMLKAAAGWLLLGTGLAVWLVRRPR